MMTVYEKLLKEFGAAIIAVYGDKADEEFENQVDSDDLIAIAKKVKFYLE